MRASAPIFLYPDERRQPIVVAKEGSILRVLGDDGAWYNVEFRDPALGPRQGFILKQSVTPPVADYSRVPATEVSIDSRAASTATNSGTTTSVDASPTNAPNERAQASSRNPPSFARNQQEHGWVNVDFARFQSLQDAQTYTLTTSLYRETAAAATAYPKLATVDGVDLSGGILFGPGGLGAAVRFYGVNYENTVGMAVTIPSPYFFNTADTDAGVTTLPLKRQDRVLDVSAAYTVPSANYLRVRIFGGPSFFSLTNDMISVINYSQVASSFFPLNAVVISSHTDKKVSKSTIGFNIGGDVAVFFTRYLGVGGTVRFNRGNVTIVEPLSSSDAELRLGHTAFGGGLRLRF